MDFAAEGLLAGLEGEARADRERLLAWLVDEGFSPAQLRQAVAENRLVLLAVDRVFGATHTAQEIADETGLPAEMVLRIRRLQGLPANGPQERVYSDDDIAAARSVRLFRDAGFDDDRIVEITQVLGEGMSRLAAAIVAAFGDTFLQAGDSEREVAIRFSALAQELTPAVGPILIGEFKAHLRDSVQRSVLGLEELRTGEPPRTQDVAVCFADVVGFTRLGGQVGGRELGTVAGRLASLSASLAEPPVRLVKTIGDAAMLVSPDPEPLVGVALALVESFEQEELPTLRAGTAFGAAEARAGDYYGHAINLASRVTGVARPGSVLCTREVRDAAPDAYQWSSAGRHKLKGVSGPTPLYRARPRLREDGAAP